MSLQMEGQIIEGQVEIQDGGYIEMTSETMTANMDSQRQMQIMCEQEMSLFQMNGDGMMMGMQSQVNAKQQEGTYVEMSTQELSIDPQLQGFSQQVMMDEQIVQGQHCTDGGGSRQILSQEMQNMAMTEMPLEGTCQYGGQVIMLEGGFTSETGVGYGGIQVLEMTAQGMDAAGVQSQGIITQETNLEMAGEDVQSQRMSAEGGGIVMEEMSMGVSGQMQQITMQNMQSEVVEDVIYSEGGEIKEGHVQMSEMSMGEINGSQIQMQEIPMPEITLEMQSQEMGFGELQMSGTTIQAVGFVEGGEIPMSGMSMQEVGFVEGEGIQMNEITIQEVGFVEGGDIQMSGMSMQEVGFAEGGGIQMNETTMHEVGFVEQGEIEMSGMSMQEVGSVEEVGIQMNETAIQEVGFVEEGEIQISGMSMQEVRSVEGEGIQMDETAIQEVGFVEGGDIQMSGMSMQEVGSVEGEGIQVNATAMQEVGFVEEGEIQMSGMSMREVGSVEGEEIQMNDTAIQDLGLVEGGDIQMSGMSMQEMGFVEEVGIQMNETTMQEVGFVEGGEIQISGMSMQEVGSVEGEGIQINETATQEVGFVEQGDIQMSGMSMQEVGFVEGEGIQINETATQEVGFVEGGDIQMHGMSMREVDFVEEVGIQMNETAIQEVGFVEEGEIQISGMSMQEVGSVEGEGIQMNETAIQEVGFVEEGEIQMSGMSMQEVGFEEGEGIQINEATIQEARFLEGDEIKTSGMSMQEVGFLEGEGIQMKDAAIQEVGFVERGEIQMSGMSMQGVSFAEGGEIAIQEVGFVEGGEIQMSEMSIEELGFVEGEEIQMSEAAVQEVGSVEGGEIQLSGMPLRTQEVCLQEVCTQEMPMQQTTLETQEKSTQEMSMQEMSLETKEMPLETQEMSLQEMTMKQTPLETQMQEMPLETQEQIEMTSMVMQEIPIETSQENAAVEGGELKEEPLDMNQQPTQEVTITEFPWEVQGEELSVSTAEITIQEIPVDTTSQEIQMPIANSQSTDTKEAEIQEIPLPQESGEMQEVNADVTSDVIKTTLLMSEETALKVQPETISCPQVQSQEHLPVENNVETEKVPVVTDAVSQRALPVGDNTATKQENTSQSKRCIDSIEDVVTGEPKPLDSRQVQGTSSTPQLISTIEDSEVSGIEKTTSDENEYVREIVTEKVSCDHNILIEKFLERITRLENEKEYLEGRYNELRQEKETASISREEQVIIQDNYKHHCCDIMKDYSSIIDYFTSPHEDRSEARGYFVQGGKENLRISSQMSDDYEYYKSKCDQIKRENERLQRAYETEKRQREDLERDYRNENDEKTYLEERYQEMLDSINRFDETIRSLRRDNELLQQNLSDWANSRVLTQTLEINSMVLQNSDDGADIAEYKKNIQALEKENREFRTILDVLSKKNESQESLKGIELGLSRENELIELKRERARLESSVREMKRTNKSQQERIEEIRRESTTEIFRLKEKHHKLEKSHKETQRITHEKDDEIVHLKKRHAEELQGMEMRFQNDLSNAILGQNQIKDLKAQVQRLEEDRKRLRDELKTSASSGRDGYTATDADYQNIEVIRQRYEEERRGKMRLASDMKCLLSDIIDLKERNQRLQEDFNRERMEIKGMIEKQANEITHEYFTQISKLQTSLIEETKRRHEAETGRQRVYSDQESRSAQCASQEVKNALPSWVDSDLQQQLNNEIRRRETLEIENKKLLYKINDTLSGGGNTHSEEAFDNLKTSMNSPSRNETKLKTRDSKEAAVKQSALLSEIEDLHDKLEDMKKDAKRCKDLRRKNEELDEEVTHLTRKRDDLLGVQRNLTREVDYLSRALEEVEMRNRKLSEETERFTRKIQDIEDSFRQEKMALGRKYENEKARAVEEVTRLKEACEKKLQIQTESTKTLEEKIRQLEETKLQNTEMRNPLTADTGVSYKVPGDSRNQPSPSYDNKLKRKVQSLEAMLQDVNEKHADELRNLEIQKHQMHEEFQREKQSLERCFENEKEGLQKRLRDVESNIPGGAIGETEAFRGDSGKALFGNTGSQSTSENDKQMVPHYLESNLTTTASGKAEFLKNDFEKKAQEMQTRFDEEKRDILNRASKDKTKMEEEAREAKEKLTSYRRLLEDEMDDLKRKHRQELDYVNEKLLKERAEFEERLRMDRGNRSTPRIEMTELETKSGCYSLRENGNKHTDQDMFKDELEKQKFLLTSEFDKDKGKWQSEKRKLTEAIHFLTKETTALKCEMRNSKNSYKQEIEKIARIHDVEKVTLLQRAARDKDEEISRIKDDYEDRLSSDRNKSQKITDELRRKMSVAERKVKDIEMQQKDDKMKYQEEKIAAEKSFIQSREELKMTVERGYRKMLDEEKLKYEQSVKALKKQLFFLQDQRKEIQAKLVSNELSGNSITNTEQLLRNRVKIQVEQEFLERADRERRPMENKIKDLQQEISTLKREKTELKETLENEKQQLEEELEKIREDMRRKLSKAKEEMDRTTEAVSKTMVANRVKNVLACCDASPIHSTQCDVRQYKDQMNLMEQRNMTLKAKTERLERELRVMGDRLRTLETRNKDLETTNREEWMINRGDMLQQSPGYKGEPEYRGLNDVLLGPNSAGLRSETRVYQPNFSLRLNTTNGQTLASSGQPYGDILERVRYTMHATGSISDALGSSAVGSTNGRGNASFTGNTSVGLRQSMALDNGPLNQTAVSSLGRGNVVCAGYSGVNTRFLAGNAGVNVTATSNEAESINQPAVQLS